MKNTCWMLISIFLWAFPVRAQEDEHRHVLLLNSYNQDMTWVQNITQAVEDVLKPYETGLILHVENMDTKRHLNDGYLNKLSDLYAQKYKHVPFDLILSSDNNAFDFLRKNRSILFPNVPVVFSGVNNFKPSQITGYPGFTGVAEVFSDVDTIKMMLRLHPGTRKIFIVNDYTPTGQAWTKAMVENIAAAGLDKQVGFSFAGNLSLEKMQSQLGQLGDDVLILLGVYFKDLKGSYLTYEKIGQFIVSNTRSPVYALLKFNVSGKVVGGNVISGYSQGQEAAKMGLQILSGAAPASIPVIYNSNNRYVFNWPQLKKWNINSDLLPKGSQIINRPPSFYDQNKTLVWVLASLIGLLMLAILTQLWLAFLQRKANRGLGKLVTQRTAELLAQKNTLQASEEALNEAQQVANVGSWHLNTATNEVVWSNELYIMYGFDPALPPPPFTEHQKLFTPESWETLSASLSNTIEKGIPYELELETVKDDGGNGWVWVRGEAVLDESGVTIGLRGVSQDITERKRITDALLDSELSKSEILWGTNVGTWEWNVQTGETVFNERWADIIGYTLEEISPTSIDTWMEFAHPDDLEISGELLKKNFTRELDYYDFEARMRHKNGEWVWVLDRGKVVEWTKDGEPLRMSGTHSDISKRKLAEIQISDANERFNTVLSGLDATVYVADMETYEVLYVNDLSKKLFGDVTGRKCWETIQKDQSGPCSFCTNDRLLTRDGSPKEPYVWEFENSVTGAWLQCRDRAIPWNDGRLVRIEIATDITERKLAEENLKISEEHLRYEVGVKNRFFSIIAHDLKSPFTSLLGMTQMMSQMADSFSKEKLVEYATSVNQAGDKVFELLQNLLEWSRLQMEGAKQEPKKIELAALTQECMDILNPIALEKNIAIANNISNMSAFADQDMVRTVMRNLIANSIKFTPSGGSINISASSNKNMVQVTVTDTGVGISEDQAAKVFSLDQKTSTKGTAGETGTGLGLPLCKEMIERNEGEIWLQSTPGEGSRFHFTLPLPQVEE